MSTVVIFWCLINRNAKGRVRAVGARQKAIRQFFGILETLNWLSIKLFFKNRPLWRNFPGLVFRDYMSLARQEKWKCRDIFRAIAATAEHSDYTRAHAGRGYRDAN